MSMRSDDKKYGGVAKGLHWGIALLIVGLLISGTIVDGSDANSTKIMVLRAHVVVGISVLGLVLFRIFWWLKLDRKPAPIGDVRDMKSRLAGFVHILLYVVPLGMVASGIGMMVLTGAGEALFFQTGVALPDFEKVPPRAAHGIGAKLFIGLIALHSAAALYHHFGVKDNTLKRMWFSG